MSIVTTQKQHLVSQVILREFCAGQNREIMVYDLLQKTISTSTPADEAYVRGLTPPSLRGFEEEWSRVESRAPSVLNSLKNKNFNPDKWKNELAPVLLKLIAIHFIRSSATISVWQKRLPENVSKSSKNAFRCGGPLLNAYAEENKLKSIDDMTITELRRSFEKNLVEELKPGGERFAKFIKDIEARVAKDLTGLSVEIGIAPKGKDFIIGDTPALTYDKNTKKVGILEGVPFNMGDGLFLPLGPRFTAAVVGKNINRPLITQITEQQVDTFNKVQIQGSIEKVYFKRSVETETWLRANA